jgi:hypothetical protein
MSAHIRKRLFVDFNVQGAIVRRIALYFCSAVLFILLPSAIFRTCLKPDQLFLAHLRDVIRDHWPLLLTLLSMLPFVFYDVVRLTNRFAGPIYRLRQQLERFQSGEEIQRIKFRDGDFWPDLATLVSSLVERVRVAEASAAPAQSGEDLVCSSDDQGKQQP